jgi:CHAT domain-containing protein
LRVAPILYKRSCTKVLIERIVGIPDDPGELLLAEAELNHISKIFDQAICTFVNKTDEEPFLEAMKAADALVITTHGFPLANFKDPYFASLGGPDIRHVINTATIQREFIDLPYSLVLINSCHGTASRPKGPSYDMVSFPVLMLMNKTSSIIASSWKTLDKISYLFSHVLFETLKENSDIDSAYMEALLKLATMDGDRALDVLAGIEDEKIRDKVITESSKENLNQMLHHPYCYGTFQLYTLF